MNTHLHIALMYIHRNQLLDHIQIFIRFNEILFHINFNRMVQEDVEAEMRRLKLELKQTMEMYSTACKEALTAKQKVREIIDRLTKKQHICVDISMVAAMKLDNRNFYCKRSNLYFLRKE